MTIAVCVKVDDGVVLAADSAATIMGQDSVYAVYNSANKIFNLHKRLPIGAIGWGLGGVGRTSMSTLAKDLRGRFMDAADEWYLESDYRMQDVAERFGQFMFEAFSREASAMDPEAPDTGEEPEQDDVDPAGDEEAEGRTNDRAYMGFLVVGFSADGSGPEQYRIEIKDGAYTGAELERGPDQWGVSWGGDGEALCRLVLGFGTGLAEVFVQNLGVPDKQAWDAIEVIGQRLDARLCHPAMPLQDAIDLAQFLADTSIGLSRFTPGWPTIGGPVDVAAISKHEGYKWIRRKHYYGADLNPEVPR